jgi:eukaryotic-like serine/threonine-protein kinase
MATDLRIGERLGVWRIERAIGKGGMGAVYLAARADGQFDQTAALKVLTGLANEKTQAFLARERQVLSALSHPNIARLIDGGTTESGRLYFAMDYVDGVDIERYCREKHLALPAFVELYRVVCRAVDYAHQRLTLHCDIKPSNVLVEPQGRPVLLDFGIAQAVDQSLGDARVSAHHERAFVFTPKYASPEQKAGLPLGTATDVYSLGKMFSALLGFVQVPRARRFELDAMIARATAEAPADRYLNVAAFESDLARFLRREPLSALPKAGWYTAQKYIERRWVLLSAVVAFLSMAILLNFNTLHERDRARAAEVVATQELARAQRAEADAHIARGRAETAERLERDRAEEAATSATRANVQRDRAVAAERTARFERDRALKAEALALVEGNTTKATRDFLLNLFNSMSSSNPGIRKVTAYEMLERGKGQIANALADQPKVRAELYEMLGKIYDNVGELDTARGLYRDAEKLEPNQAH